MDLAHKFRTLTFKELKRRFDNKYGFGKIEWIIASNWLNLWATVYLNLRSLSLSQAWKMPIFVYGRPRFYNLSGKIEIKGKLRPGMITFNQTCPGTPSLTSVQSEFINQGTIIFYGSGEIKTGTKIRVSESGFLEIGDDFGIADMVNIGCYSRISIGNHCRIAHRCQILDSNYHYIANLNNRTVPMWRKPIVIGDRCWIGNSTTVAGGTVLPDSTIVASHSLVNRDLSAVPCESIVGGSPARLLRTGYVRVYNPHAIEEINGYYAENGDGMFVYPEEVRPESYFF